jgi:hypothetical protein
MAFWKYWGVVSGIDKRIIMLPAVWLPYRKVSLTIWIIAGIGSIFIALILTMPAKRHLMQGLHTVTQEQHKVTLSVSRCIGLLDHYIDCGCCRSSRRNRLFYFCTYRTIIFYLAMINSGLVDSIQGIIHFAAGLPFYFWS